MTLKHEFQSAAEAIKTAEERTGEKFTLSSCPHCGHHANLCDPQKDPTSWGSYQWEIVCSSSHCRARVCIVADGWFEQVDMEMNPGYPSNGYRDRVTDLRRMWNRRFLNQYQAAQIKYMVDRFLSWRLPENFNPDGGVSFKKTFNDHMPQPMKHEPSGTNLLDATQADAMVRHMIEGMPR